MGSSDFDLPLPEFLAAVAAETPAPGGGSAAAVTGAMAAALVEMSARYSHEWDGAGDVVTSAGLLREKLLRLAAEDAEAFAAYLEADPSERASALARATEVPRRVEEAARDVLILATRVRDEGNPNLEGDAKVALHLATCARSAAQLLIKINREKGG